MNVAEHDLSYELKLLSGWKYDDFDGFSMGYLLEKKLLHLEPFVGFTMTDGWVAYTKNFNVREQGAYIERELSPADAVAKLAIELFKNGILTREDKE